MAFEEIKTSITLEAPSTAFSASQYRMVQQSSSEGIFVAGSTAAVDQVNIGVLQDAPTFTGEPCEIATFGSVTKLEFATTMVAGVNFISGALGRGQDTGAATTGQVIYGPILSTVSTTLGTIGTVMFNVVGITT